MAIHFLRGGKDGSPRFALDDGYLISAPCRPLMPALDTTLREEPRETPQNRRAGLGDRVAHAPQYLRALVRTDEIWLVVLAAITGIGAGILVSAITVIAQTMHRYLFALSPGEDVSTATDLTVPRTILVPVIGGVLVGIAGLLIARFRRRRAVDPIEANALYGGTMSINDSLCVIGQTLLSNGFGASVGLEAGYTQIGAAFASRIGRSFRLRRNDLRLLVGCGAAGAIAAAFNAPIAGAFYAYELVIGTYTIAALAPVVVAAIVADGVAHLAGGFPEGLDLIVPGAIEGVDYVALIVLSLVCSLIAIAIMRSVTLIEQAFRRTGVPPWARPAVGGLLVGLLALSAPSVFSSGHAALEISIEAPYSLHWVAILILLKATANAISIGAGFIGGMFFASIYLGGLVGKLFAGLLATITLTHTIPVSVCALVGMTSMAVAVVGGPLTMTFLALEETGSLPLTAAVLAACVVSSLTVRRLFGYSFTTWRFHLRGEAIRSAVDIGWIRTLTVNRIMRKDIPTVRSDVILADFHHDYPLGTAKVAVVTGQDGKYAGIVHIAEAHTADDHTATLADVLRHHNAYLLPEMNIKVAIATFEQTESDALAVVDNPENRHVIGLLTEQHALRRYSEELDRKRRELSGE